MISFDQEASYYVPHLEDILCISSDITGCLLAHSKHQLEFLGKH